MRTICGFLLTVAGAIALSAFAQAQAQTAPGPGNSAILKRIAERGAIVFGHRESSVPFSFLNAEQKVEGYSIDYCQKIADSIRAQLGRADLKIRYVPVNVTSRIPLVANGTIDIECGTTTNTFQRQEQVAFSPVFYLTGTQILVSSASTVKDFEDLAGKRIAMLQGSTTEAFLRTFSDEKKLNYRFVFARDNAEALLLVQSDRVDAFITDGGLLKTLAATRAQPPGSLKVVGRLLTYEPYGLMMQRGDDEFALLVRRTLADTFRSGEAEAIFEKWFGSYGIKPDDDLRAAFRIQALPR